MAYNIQLILGTLDICYIVTHHDAALSDAALSDTIPYICTFMYTMVQFLSDTTYFRKGDKFFRFYAVYQVVSHGTLNFNSLGFNLNARFTQIAMEYNPQS